MHEVIHEGVHYFTHADKGIFLLVRQLLFKKGNVAKEYIAGKRKKYFPPLNFYLLVATIMVLIFSFVSSPSSDVASVHPEVNQIKDPVQKQKVIRIYERQGVAVNFINKYSNIVAMIAVPLIAFIYWLFYLRGRYNYTEHLVGCMYMTGFTNLIYAILFVPVSLIFAKGSNISFLLIMIFILFQVIYNAIFYYHFIGKNTITSAIKASAVSFIGVGFWFSLSAILVGVYIKNGFWGLLN